MFNQARRRILATVTKLPKGASTKRSAQFNSFASKSLSLNSARAFSTSVGPEENHDASLKWMKMLAGAAAAGTFVSTLADDEKANCCGIAGVIGTKENDAR